MAYRSDGVRLFLPHPDIIHHSSMDTEFTLHPDDCSYGAIPYNTVHARQPWTNYDLRGAVKKITEASIAPYLSIQGIHITIVSTENGSPTIPRLTNFGMTEPTSALCP